MSKEDWIANPVHKILQVSGLWPFDKINTVLDVACGLSLKSRYLEPCYILGIDVHEPYLRAIDYDKPYGVIKYDVRNISNIILHDSFEVVYLLDIIEHLTELESISLIHCCKNICTKAVVIETPLGYIPQDLDIQGFGAHSLQTHRCGWNIEDLEPLGFKCIVRDYTMQDVRRHTTITVNPKIKLIDGIYIKNG